MLGHTAAPLAGPVTSQLVAREARAAPGRPPQLAAAAAAAGTLAETLQAERGVSKLQREPPRPAKLLQQYLADPAIRAPLVLLELQEASVILEEALVVAGVVTTRVRPRRSQAAVEATLQVEEEEARVV